MLGESRRDPDSMGRRSCCFSGRRGHLGNTLQSSVSRVVEAALQSLRPNHIRNLEGAKPYEVTLAPGIVKADRATLADLQKALPSASIEHSALATQAYWRSYLPQFLPNSFTDTGMLKSTPACRFVSSVACRSIVFSGISRVRPAAASSST